MLEKKLLCIFKKIYYFPIYLFFLIKNYILCKKARNCKQQCSWNISILQLWFNRWLWFLCHIFLNTLQNVPLLVILFKLADFKSYIRDIYSVIVNTNDLQMRCNFYKKLWNTIAVKYLRTKYTYCFKKI